ncbi:MAG TPA: alcohol dehydrogenase catalytic domain-containing protein [Capillimicrobium sp.]
MQQLIFVEPGRVEAFGMEAPEPRSGRDAIVRPCAVATCDLDLGIVRGATPWRGPLPIGHEGVAEVMAIGDDVRGVAVGDLVCVPYQVSCGSCRRCVLGLTANCEGHGGTVPGPQFYGWSETARQWGGFFADAVRVPFADHMLVGLPPGLDPAQAASVSDNVVDGWRTVADPIAQRPGEPVLVVGGSGAIGLYAVDAAVALGAPVTYVDRSARRLRIAETLGAEVVAVTGSWPRRLGPFAITVDANSTEAGLMLALRSTDCAGICTSAGMHFSPIEIELFEFYRTGITLRTGLIQARVGMEPVLELIAAGRLRPHLVTDRVLPWDDAAEALVDVREKLVFERATRAP